MSWLDTWRPEILCLGAGGIKGLDELGAIWWFWCNGNLEKVDTYIGSSIGGIICALMAMGWSPHHILEYAIDAELFNNISELPVTQMIHEFGIVSNKSFDDALGKKLGEMIEKKLGKIPTLLEFYEKTKKRVVFVIVSLKDEKLVYADHLSHPDMNLMTALRSTSNSPVVFGKLEHQKDFLVDGAVMDPFPINYLDDGRRTILGIGVRDQRDWIHNKMNVVNYYDRIVSLALKKLTDNSLANMSEKCYAVIIPVKDEAGLLKMGGRDSRLEKFLSGYQCAENHVKRFPLLNTFTEKKEEEPPLTLEVLKACFKSHAAKLILRSMKEAPELFQECLKSEGVVWSSNVETHSNSKVETQSNSNAEIVVQEKPSIPVPKESPMDTSGKEIIQVPNTEQDEDILEIPREAFRPFPDNLPRRQRSFFSPFQRSSFVPFPMPNMGIVVTVDMDPRILDQVYEMIMGTIGLLRVPYSSSSQIRKQ